MQIVAPTTREHDSWNCLRDTAYRAISARRPHRACSKAALFPCDEMNLIAGLTPTANLHHRIQRVFGSIAVAAASSGCSSSPFQRKE